MSNFATVAQLQRATSQLPVSWYCSPEIHVAEQKHLYARGPSYVGHELMAPNLGDYCVLASRDNAQALVRNPDACGRAKHRWRIRYREAERCSTAGAAVPAQGKGVSIMGWSPESHGGARTEQV